MRMGSTSLAKMIWILETILVTGVNESRDAVHTAAPKPCLTRALVLGVCSIPASRANPATVTLVYNSVLVLSDKIYVLDGWRPLVL